MATVTVLTGFALIAQVIDTPDGAVTPDLVLQPIQNQNYGVLPFSILATSNSIGAITYSIVSGPATIQGNVITVTGVGLVTVQVNQAAAGNFLSGTLQGSFSVAPSDPSLAFESIENQTYQPNQTIALDVVSESSGTITLYVVSGPATISGTTLTITGAGTITVGAGQVATQDYTAGSATTSFQVFPATATVTIAPIMPGAVAAGSQIPVSASSLQSNGVITFSILAGPATVMGSTITLTSSSGAVTVEASLAPTQNYGSASATESFEFGNAGFGQSFGYFGSGL